MNILHVFSMAGVAEILTNESQTLGHKSFVMQMRGLDPFKFGDYYGETVYYEEGDILLKDAYQAAKTADFVILHDFVQFRKEFPKNKLILYFHGSILRENIKKDPKLLEELEGYRCIVSTQDLLDILPNALYLPAPCDRKLFRPQKLESDNWLAINRSYQKEFIEPKIREKYPLVEYRTREDSIIPYNQMPLLLRKYGNYVDWKFDYSKPIPKSVQALSTTAIQALSCGLKVWDKDGLQISSMLLLLHDSKNVTERFLDWLVHPN